MAELNPAPDNDWRIVSSHPGQYPGPGRGNGGKELKHENRRDFDQLSNWIKNIDQSLQKLAASNKSANDVSGLQDLEKSLSAAATLTEPLSSNQHFDIRQAVSDFYTGRETLLDELRENIVPPPGVLRGQRRFVIYGMGGSGKTQFCCKFAADTRERCVLLNNFHLATEELEIV